MYLNCLNVRYINSLFSNTEDCVQGTDLRSVEHIAPFQNCNAEPSTTDRNCEPKVELYPPSYSVEVPVNQNLSNLIRIEINHCM